MSIIKLPCILVATVGVQKTFTAPNVSSKDEEFPAINLWDRYLITTRKLMKGIKVRSSFQYWFSQSPRLSTELRHSFLAGCILGCGNSRGSDHLRQQLAVIREVEPDPFHADAKG
jgi:hypothetical protein